MALGAAAEGEEAGEHVAATVALVLALVLAVAIVLKVAVAVAYAEWSQTAIEWSRSLNASTPSTFALASAASGTHARRPGRVLL